VSKDDYVKAFEAATRELEQLMQQRAELDTRILQLRQTLVSLSHLCGFTPTVSWGMTDGVRFIVRRAQRPLTPIEVRDELANWGFDMSKYANDLSVIHTTLKRLNQAGELRFVIKPGGVHAYEWQSPPRVVVLTEPPTRKGRK
jgi:hypothetical protein